MPATKTIVVTGVAVVLLFGVVAGWFGPMAGDDAVLLQIPTVVLLALLVVAAWRGWLDTVGFVSAAAFLALHSVAAYYGYCNVPYDDWTESLFGFRFASWFDSDRNHYDRFMHFAYGLLMLLPVRQAAGRMLGLRGFAATWVAIEFILATSLLYEVAEWLIAVFMAPDVADRYNGQQGDMWDAQKDMALAACGAIVAAGVSLAAWAMPSRLRRGGATR